MRMGERDWKVRKQKARSLRGEMEADYVVEIRDNHGRDAIRKQKWMGIKEAYRGLHQDNKIVSSSNGGTGEKRSAM